MSWKGAVGPAVLLAYASVPLAAFVVVRRSATGLDTLLLDVLLATIPMVLLAVFTWRLVWPRWKLVAKLLLTGCEELERRTRALEPRGFTLRREETHMRKALAVTTFMTLALALPQGLHAQGPVLDQRLARAQKVAVGFDSEFGFTAQPPTPEDRDARYAVLSELEGWGRYQVVSNPDHADLLIAIRIRWSVEGAGGSTARHHHGLKFRGAGAVKADSLSVYDARYRKATVPLWRHNLVVGLSGSLPLLEKLRSDVAGLDGTL